VNQAICFTLGVLVAVVWGGVSNRHVIGFTYYCGYENAIRDMGASAPLTVSCQLLKTIVEWM
jgi:hypothetical protein